MNIRRKKHHRQRKRKEKKLATPKESYLDKVLKDPELRKAEWERLRRYPFRIWPRMSGYIINDKSPSEVYHCDEDTMKSLALEALRRHSPLLDPPLSLSYLNNVPHSTADDFLNMILPGSKFCFGIDKDE